MARAAFAHTAAYDAQIVAWLDRGGAIGEAPDGVDATLPSTLHLTLERASVLRYGENPHQVGARYRLAGTTPWWDGVTQHAGSALSYSEPLRRRRGVAPRARIDAWTCRASVRSPSSSTPTRRARPSAPRSPTRFKRRWTRTPKAPSVGSSPSAASSIVALAALIAEGPQADVIIASSIHPDAVETLVKRRKATRLLSAPSPETLGRSVRTFGDTALVQNADELLVPVSAWKCVTTATPTDRQLEDLAIAWRVCARTTSNAIVIARDGVAVGIGAGQQSRVVAAQIATTKAGEFAKGGAAASDAFFPFADGLESLTSAGVTSVVQPGGSVRDQEVIDAANAAEIVMMLTGERHFRH